MSLASVSSVFATVHYDPANSYCFTFPAYLTAMRFASAQTWTSVLRVGNFWYFDGLEFSVQNGNLTVDSLWAGNIFQGHVAGVDSQLAVVTIYDIAYSVPVTVLCSSASVGEVADPASFLSSAVSCWFYDAGSGRTYLKLLIAGYTSFSVDYNAGTGGGPTGGGPSGGGANVQVSNCTVNVASGNSATGQISVSWNFVGSVTLTQISFQGDSASWLHASTVPLTLAAGNASIPVAVTVPSGVADGTYTVQVSSQFTFSGGVQTVVSHLNVQVGAAQSSFLPAWLTAWFSSAWTLLLANVWLFMMAISIMVCLIVVAVVARRRRY